MYKLALGTLLLTIGAEEYAERYDLLWDFYVWACPGINMWGVAIIEPILEGGVCIAVAISWQYVYSEGRPAKYQQTLLFFFIGALLATIVLVLAISEGRLGEGATGQVCIVLFVYMMTLRPLVEHCLVMLLLVFVGFVAKILASGNQCDVIADVAMVFATIGLGMGAAFAALER